jgi:hypothetical protein
MADGSNLTQRPHGIFIMSRVGLYSITGKQIRTQHFIHGRGVWVGGERRRVNMSTVATREPPILRRYTGSNDTSNHDDLCEVVLCSSLSLCC